MIELFRGRGGQKLRSPVTAHVDPTPFAVAWFFPDHDEDPMAVAVPTAAGSWQTTPGRALNANRWQGIALSPLIGAAATIDLPAGAVYDMFLDVAAGAQGQPLLFVGSLRVK